MQARARSISKRQIKLIHALKNALELSDREYRLNLLERFTVRTSKDLSYDQAETFIRILENEAVSLGAWERFEGQKAFEDLAGRPGMATPAQLRKIEALWRSAMDIRGREKRKKGLRTWLDRHFGISDLRFLPQGKVSKVLKALGEMEARKEAKVKEKRNEPF